MNLDELLKEFQEKTEKAVSKERSNWEGTKEDEIYNVDIHIWRKPGTGNSLQTIFGNNLSIMTATTSYLQTLLEKQVIDEKQLKQMVDFAIKMYKKTK